MFNWSPRIKKDAVREKAEKENGDPSKKIPCHFACLLSSYPPSPIRRASLMLDDSLRRAQASPSSYVSCTEECGSILKNNWAHEDIKDHKLGGNTVTKTQVLNTVR